MRISPEFAAGGPKHLYIEQLQAELRDHDRKTPAYPALSAAFASAFNEAVVQGRPVDATLDAAARRVEDDLREHQYYPPPS